MRHGIAALTGALILAAACGRPAPRQPTPAGELPRPGIAAIWPHSDYKPFQSEVYARRPEWIDRELDWMRSVGINLYFPLAFSSGRVNWPSTLFHDTRVLYASASPVDRAVRGADTRGIATHLYFILGFVGFLEDAWAAPDLRARPDWDVVGENGSGTLTGQANNASSWGTFLWWDLGNPDVQEKLLGIMTEALDRYPTAEGVHLDYIRSPNNGGCFSPACLARFTRATTIVVPDTLRDAAARARWIKANHGDAYLVWRTGEITDFVRRISELVKRKRSNATLSAAVFAGAEGAYRNVFQDWRRWAAEGLVDQLYPMFYGDAWASTGIGEYLRRTRAEIAQRRTDGGRPDVIVLGVQTAPYDPLPPGQLADAIEQAVQNGAAGVALQMLPYFWREEYTQFRTYYSPRSDDWPQLWNYDAVLRRYFVREAPAGSD